MRTKQSINRIISFTRIEFWAAITLFTILLIVTVSDAYEQKYPGALITKHIVIFMGFMALNFIIVPAIVKRHRLLLYIPLLIPGLVFVFLIMGICDTYIRLDFYAPDKSTSQAHEQIFGQALVELVRLVLLFALYTGLRYAGRFLVGNAEEIREKYRFLTPGGLIAFVVYLMILFLLLVADADGDVILAWMVVIFCGIVFYLYAFYKLIPKSLKSENAFVWYIIKSFLILLASFLPVAILILFTIESDDVAFTLSFQNSFVHFFITTPLCWVLYKRYMRGSEEMYALKTELGKSNANLDFLRSQINPHFLFNALNTIYGTAIQEKAERTSEGVERLADMMRFMLQENMQDKISLAREIEYLNNFIGLQRLRTDPMPEISIQTRIDDRENMFQIAPMLLIPFVENAFKHGISLREPSHIKITLEIKNTTLYLDVYNSKHDRQSTDPEKDKSGIGLENVKQRLKLLYSNKHELIIRDTSKEFFVHLTLQLK
ncbi:MAG: histidine kinase [Gemmatimonadaceae bacterium]|nr:histidine kinase [Chitinophagaceae bacterium]